MSASAVLLVFVNLTMAAAQGPPAMQHPHETGQAPARLGEVHFATSCGPALQADVNRAVALLHSFWFNASAAAFTTVAEKDPSCGIAWVGTPAAPSRRNTSTPRPSSWKRCRAAWTVVSRAVMNLDETITK